MAKKQKGKTALEIIEEAVHILRSNPVRLLSVYFIGSLPFVIAFLYFWADMSRSAFATEYCISASLGLAMLFIWMKCWHTVFCRKVMAYISQQSSSIWSTKRILRMICTQSFLSSIGIIVLPIVLIIAVPFGWVYAFYQNLSAEDNGRQSLKEVVKKSWHLANLWPGQNHIILFIISVFSLLVFLNICVTIYLLPILLKKLLGVDTVFALSGFKVLSTTFLSAGCGLTYLCIDPVLKTIYTLRCFYGSSLKSGDDLRTDLISLKGCRKGLSFMLILWFCSSFLINAYAYEPTNKTGKAPLVKEYITPEKLDKAIEEIMHQREFIWRMPKENLEKEDEEFGTLEHFIFWAIDNIRDLLKFINNWWNKIRDWFKSLFPDIEPARSNNRGWLNTAHIMLYSILIILVCLMAIILWRLFKSRKRSPVKISGEAVFSIPDLSDGYVNPVELPADRWLTIGKDLMKKQSLRLALRAFYLSILARLAEKNMITIAKYKSNMDYMGELERRAHEYKELLSLFSFNIKLFDRSWYGMHEVTGDVIDRFIEAQERMITIVQS